jgi:hypothetical protein
VEGEDDLRLVPAFETQGEHGDLNSDRRQRQRIIAVEQRVGRIEEVGRQQERQHQAAEQAGPPLLETEQQKFKRPCRRARRDLDRFQPGAYAGKAGGVGRLDHAS